MVEAGDGVGYGGEDDGDEDVLPQWSLMLPPTSFMQCI